MYEIARGNTIDWGKHQKNSRYILPKHVQILCQNGECITSLVGIEISWVENNDLFSWARPQCTVCKEKITLFVLNPKKLNTDEVDSARIFAYPAPTPELEIPKGLEDISPRFIKVYAQANLAGEMGLDELVGMGYRKALEILVKDYAIRRNPDKEEQIKRNPSLKAIINKYFEDARIKEIARRASWLGNDETHYERRWQDKDIADLKKLMKLTTYWIAMDVTAEQVIMEMPDPTESQS